MSEEIRNETRRKVSSVGNSWIVCKSKSHPGHVYYFNSLTGETAWNLSDAEIEKAKHRTKHLEHLPGAKSTKCPEPKDKPPTFSNSSQLAQSLPSEQLVINRISEQQSSILTYSNIANSNATFSTPFNQISGVMQGNQIDNSSSIAPLCTLNAFNNSLSTFSVNTTPTLYNPKVWAVPHTQQVFIAPAIDPTVNHSPGSLNVAFNHLSQTVPQPATGLVFNSFNDANQSRGSRAFNPRNFNYDHSVKRTITKNMGFANKVDLRQKLSFKKRLNNISSVSRGSGLLKVNPRSTDIAASNVDGTHSNDLSTGMESRSDPQLHETPSKIDLGPLKSLASPDCNSDAWFIVVDLEVLLHEFKFLNTLTDSDEKCHLMVPKRVMEELKNYVSCSENIQAKRILRFLSQHIEIGYAYMGHECKKVYLWVSAEEPSKVEGGSMADTIHATCTELIDTNYHLVLLTNDNELLTKRMSGINMFCIDEIKNLLMENPNKQLMSSSPKKPFLSNELINKIKITVPNAPQNRDPTSPVTDIETKDHVENNPIIKPPKQNNTPEKKEELVVLKNTVDAGIQTDFEDINATINMTNVVEKQSSNIVLNSPAQNTKQADAKRLVSLISNNLDKRREIKLKRSTSYQPSVNCVESGKKQFKWRRRRNTSHVNEQIPFSNEQKNNTNIVESQQTNTNIFNNNEISKHPDIALNKILTLGHTENKISDDSIESRESSIYTDPKNFSTKENITIEETSTSGIISNTESNIDADSTYSNSASSVNQQLIYNRPSNKPMYEVDSMTMAQCLSMKCDEWISRFIQIMEEVLSQVLQQEPSFTHKAMPPPWTLHEAAQCIAIKFSGNQEIITATQKLSNVLMEVSDARGKITMNMTPHQYMKMYSYGVHLLAAIMEVITSSEDIQIAVESLNKLLHDIKNPNTENSTNDVFNDKHDNVSNNVSNCSDVGPTDYSGDNSLHEQEMLLNCNRIEETAKVSPNKRKSSEELQKPVKFIRNIDIPFSLLKSMGLQKSNTLNKVNSPIQSHEEQHSTHPLIGEGNNSSNANETIENGTGSGVPTNQPNIIRQFSKCPELEHKLKIKKNYNMKVYEDHDDDLDYNENCGEYIAEEDYCSEDQDYNKKYQYSNSNRTDEEVDTNENGMKEASLLSSENSKKFKYMMFMLLQEIKNALSQVRILCEQCYEELNNPKESPEGFELKCRLQKMAERAHLHTIRLCRSLESMLDHETNSPTQSMSDLLKQADINIHNVDARLLFEYRISVAKCKEHANEFLSSIQNIISDIKR